jgi:short-subunit dehydrogenase involved in D-alanine esterification of teichoic acids
VIATDVNFEKLKELKQERPAVVIDQLDVTKGTDIERMFKEKHLDVNVLFNCAG